MGAGDGERLWPEASDDVFQTFVEMAPGWSIRVAKTIRGNFYILSPLSQRRWFCRSLGRSRPGLNRARNNRTVEARRQRTPLDFDGKVDGGRGWSMMVEGALPRVQETRLVRRP